MEVIAEIKSFKAKKLEIEDAISKNDLKAKLCREFGIEQEVTILKKEMEIIDEKNFDKQIQKIEGIDKKDIGKCIDKYVLDYLWSRQLILYGQESFKKIRNSKIAIVGAGALGNELAKNLAFSGIGKLTIIDYDEIENSNLSKSIFFEKGDIGKPKSQVLAKKIKKVIYATEIDYINKMVEEINPLTFLDYDAIACCVDNYETRFYLSEISIKFGIPLFDAGVTYRSYLNKSFGSNGIRIQNIISSEDACIGCTISPKQLNNLKESNKAVLHCDDPKMPSNISLMSMAASFQAEQILKYLSNIGNPIKFLHIDTDHNIFRRFDLKKTKNCFVCSHLKKISIIKIKSMSGLEDKYGNFEIDYQLNNRYLIRTYNEQTSKIDKEILIEVSK